MAKLLGMGGRKTMVGGLALCLFAALSAPHTFAASSGSGAADGDADVSVVSVFAVGGAISGAVLDGDYLYVTTSTTLSIYDVSNPIAPVLLAAKPSPHFIYGELLSTQGEILLLNDGIGGGTLDIWNVEDKTNPILAGSISGVNDEHVSCLIQCTWAYGSNGSIIDLRVPQEPDLRSESWKVVSGAGDGHVHRLDEYRPGFMATAPRGGNPVFLDVRRPLKPKLVARARVPVLSPNMFLYTSWLTGGNDRFAMSSVENGQCNNEFQGALLTWDTKGWPKDRRFEVAGKYRYAGRTNDENCLAYYFSVHPDFDDGGLVLLPNGLEGTRIIEVAKNGQMEEVDSFVLPTSDVWLAFWIDEEIFYALNSTGEVYILRYE